MPTDQATDAKPKVEFTTIGLKDKAGNSVAVLTGTAAPTAVDDLSSVLTVTTSSALAEKEVTVTVNSSEALGLAPTIGTTPTKPTGSVPSVTAQTVTQTATTTWTAKYTNGTGLASLQYVVVQGTDTANITSVIGEATPATDLVSFQVDDAVPTIAFKDAGGNTLSSTDQQEGSVWIVAEFTDTDYTGDTYLTSTVSAMTLKVKDATTNLNTDVTALFSSDNKSFTLATSLTPGTYNIAITGADTAGNSATANTDFKVVAKVPFSLALKPGVNLVSIPGTPLADGGNINTLLAGKPVTSIVTYDRSLDVAGENPWLTSTKDAASGTFTGDITALEPGKAYFITATASATATVLISEPTSALPPTVSMRAGWNSVGYWSISGATSADMDAYLTSVKWTVAYAYDPTPGVGWSVHRPDANLTAGSTASQGHGYLVYVTADGTLTP